MSSDEESVHPGVHNVDTTPINLGGQSDEVVEFEADMRAVFKRLADDIYESPAAGLREALTNAVTAILRAVHRGDLEEGEGVVEFEVHDETKATRLIIRDNGIGVTEQTLKQAMAVIGRSAVRDDGEVTGQFGMGFLALFKLVGVDGGFVMHTNPRDSEEEGYSGVWKSSGFHIDEDGSLGGMADDEYGTAFELFLKDHISVDELQEFIGRYAKLARVPVIYTEYDADGQQVADADYGGQTLADAYPDDAALVTYEDEYVTAVCASKGDNRTLLLDVPIDSNGSLSGAPWWTHGVRLKREDRPIVDGPNEGMRVVSDGEYANMSAERQTDAIPVSTVHDDDVVMPGPTGNRETLQSNDAFWDWLTDRLNKAALDGTKDILSTVDSAEDVRSLPPSEMELLLKTATKSVGGNATTREIKSWISNTTEFETVTVSDNVCEVIARLRTTVYLETDVAAVADDSNTVDKQLLGVVGARARENGGRVYTYQSGSAASPLRVAQARVVFEENEGNEIARLKHSSSIPGGNCRTAIGARKLSDITPSNVFDYDVNRDTALQFARTVAEGEYNQVLKKRASNQAYNSNSTEGEEVTLHFGRKHDEKLSVQVGEVRDFCQQTPSDASYVEFRGHTHRGGDVPQSDEIVVFPSTSERNVSDYYDLGGELTAVCKCTKTAWRDVLSDVGFVTLIDDYLAVDDDTRLVTASGVVPAADLQDRENVLYHVIHDRLVEWFQKPSNAENVKKVLKAEPWSRRSKGVATDFPNISKERKRRLNSFECPDEFTYVPLTAEQYEEGAAWIDSHPVIHGSKHECFTHGTPMKGINCLTLRLYASIPGAVERGEWPDEVSRLESRVARNGRNYRPSSIDIEMVEFLTDELTEEGVLNRLESDS